MGNAHTRRPRCLKCGKAFDTMQGLRAHQKRLGHTVQQVHAPEQSHAATAMEQEHKRRLVDAQARRGVAAPEGSAGYAADTLADFFEVVAADADVDNGVIAAMVMPADLREAAAFLRREAERLNRGGVAHTEA